MSLYVYITKECQKDINQHSLRKEVEQFVNRLYSSQRATFFDNFPPPYLKKRFKRQQRLLAGEFQHNGDIIICFYRIFVRGSRDYESFLENPKKFGDDHFATLIDQGELNTWLSDQKINNVIPSRAPISDKENEFLWGLTGQQDFLSSDYFIYETYDWINVLAKESIKKRHILMPDQIINLIDKELEKGVNKFKMPEIGTLVFRKFPIHKIMLLIGIATNQDEEIALFKKYEFLLKRSDSDITLEEIIRQAGRSYPSIILADPDSWVDIVKTTDYNLALSPEESGLLRSVLDIEVEKSGFPLFINGRAGSGKSTILQYLFTDYLRHYFLGNFKSLEPPIYLTYSKSLAEKCLTIVKGLLNYNYLSRNYNVDSVIKNIEGDLNKYILEFLPFLLGMVPVQDKILFQRSHYVDYSIFKMLWLSHFTNDPAASKEYGPDLSWHIIRSYIKGISIDGYLDLEEYNELPRNERNVTNDTFKKVYNKVWDSWYKNLCEVDDNERQYWDSQDLVRYLLDNNLISPKALGVFCDEAQDFTRIELELLFRLSIFSEKYIDTSSLRKVPFAFAGDPFQTLNPTGFRWEAIKSSYVEKFIHSLAPELIFGNPELNYHELSFNYRSSRNIVKISNSIQLLRVVLFKYQNIQPQKSWYIEEIPPIPVYFLIEDPTVKQKLKDQSDIAIIVPCSEGEETEFVKKDEFLNDFIEIDEMGVPRNVFSPMRAKGLEFQRVLLYGFGEYKPKEIDFSKNIDSIIEDDIDQKIPLEYFINQLYVSASRAQKRLFILDSRTGFDSLWKFIYDSNFQDELLNRCKDKGIWENELGSLTKGSLNSWTEDKEDPMKLAEDRESEGNLKRDPYLLRQAAMLYKNASNVAKETECKAQALMIEEKYEKAGNHFYSIEQFERSLEAFWKGGIYKGLLKFVEDDQKHRLSSRFETRISALIESPKGFTYISPLITELTTQLNNADFEKQISSDYVAWTRSMNDLLGKNLPAELNKNFRSWKPVLQIIMGFEKSAINIEPKYYAEIAFFAQDFEKAVKYFEKAGETRSINYIESKAKYIKGLYENNINLDNADKKFLADYLNNIKEYDRAVEIYKTIQDSESIMEIIDKMAKSSLPFEKFVPLYLDVLIFSNDWLKVTELFSGQSKTNKNIISEIRNNPQAYIHQLVLEVSISPVLPTLENKIKERVSDILRIEFIDKNLRLWRDKYHPIVVGAAFERVGKDIDCLKYYDKITKSETFDEEIKKKALIRWILVKEKQANREEKNNLFDVANRHRSEAISRKRELNITNLDEPEFPNVAGYLATAKKTDADIELIKPKELLPKVESYKSEKSNTDKLEVVLDDIKLIINKTQKRINLEHLKSSQTASIYIEKKDCQSLDLEIQKNNDSVRIEAFRLDIKFLNDEIIISEFEKEISIVIKF